MQPEAELPYGGDVSITTLRQALIRTRRVVEAQFRQEPDGRYTIRLWVREGPGPSDGWYGSLAAGHLPQQVRSVEVVRIPGLPADGEDVAHE